VLAQIESRAPPPRRIPEPGDPLASSGGVDGAWAKSYITTRDVNIRRELIREITLRAPTEMGPIDAEPLLDQAIAGPNPVLRRTALEACLRFASTPSMVNALLESVNELGRSPQELNLLEVTTGRPAPNPRLDADEWSSQAQAALTRSLIERLAERSRWAHAERLSGELAEAHALSSLRRRSEALVAADTAAAVAERADAWTRLAGAPLWGARLDRVRTAWFGIATTEPQQALAQLDAARTVLFEMTMDTQPQLEQRLLNHDDSFRQAVGRVTHLFDQIALTEDSIATLWTLRAGLEP